MKIKSLIHATVAAVIAVGVASPALAAVKAGDLEKCYGVARSGKNDCSATGSNACAGQDTKDRDPNAWIFVLKGTCNKIVGGSLKPGHPSH